MDRGRTLNSLIIGVLATITGCVEPYPAPDVTENLSILVVDGFVNATEGSATVRLSHTIKLTDKDVSPAEKNAVVRIRSEAGDDFALTELDSGRYFADGLSINPSVKYQLYIRTSDDEEYISDYVLTKNTPPIDSITWRPSGDGVEVLANTHDESGNSLYYRWDYVETWEYHAPYLSAFKIVNGQVLYRDPNEFVYICYSTAPSTKILVGTTVRLQEDVIRDFPLTYIPRVSSRLSTKYSMKVQQRVVEKAEYEFWQDLQRITEGLGGLFDSQPYEIVGNVHHVNNPSTPVLGYFSVGFVEEKRMFIDHFDLPDELQKRPYSGCSYDTVCLFPNSGILACRTDVPNLPYDSYLITPLMNGPSVWGYTMGTQQCSDCRRQGGVLTKPDFWP